MYILLDLSLLGKREEESNRWGENRRESKLRFQLLWMHDSFTNESIYMHCKR